MTNITIPPEIITAVREAQHIGVLTGAGISAESGIPTFREAQTGLWENYNPEDLATPQAFQRDPKLVWEWYAWRRQLIAQAEPNAGHTALVELEQRTPEFSLVTQNVDNLHAKAGSQNIIELHGNITRTKCFENGHYAEVWDSALAPPLCAECGSPLRPDVVWFGEMLPPDALSASYAVADACDLFFSIGTSALVQPAASLPIIALENGATVIEVNPDSTMISSRIPHILRGPSGEVLPALVAAL